MSSAVRHAPTVPQARLTRPRPTSVAPKTAASAADIEVITRPGSVSASAGPKNPVHATYEELAGSSGSTGARYGTRPAAATRPNASARAPARPTQTGPGMRTNVQPTPSS